MGKDEPVCIADEVPFEIPESWEWCRLKDLVIYSMGKTPPRKESEYWENPCYPWVSIADMIDGTTITSSKEAVNQYSFDKVFKGKISPAGTLLMSFKLTVGKVSILGMDAFHNEAIISIFPYIGDKNATRDYLFNTLPLLSQQGDTKTAIKGNTLNSDSLDALLIPLPPLNEQLKITAKLQELQAPLSTYNTLENDSACLNNAFPELLKKSILQQAVMGKLVPQDENDEPAGILLERISAEKNALIKAGKLKKDKHESIIYRRDNSHYEKIDDEENCIDDEIPFEIPNNWEWVRLGTLVSYQNGYAYSKSDYSKHDVGIPVIKSNNLMTLQVVINHKTNYIEAPTEKMLESQIHENDLLMCLSSQSENTEPLGKTAIYRLGIPALLNQRVLKMTAYYYPIVDWMYYAINSEYFHYTVSHRSGGSAQSNLKLEHVLTMLIPIPPISEQERIINAIKASYHKISAL